MSAARKCEDCGDGMAKRRFRCPVCHYLLCNFCYGTHVKGNDDLPGGCSMHMYSIKESRTPTGSVGSHVTVRRMKLSRDEVAREWEKSKEAV